MSTMMENRPPFRTLLGHALVRDDKGEEMHKSKGNAIWFEDAAETMGADIMRWLFCSHDPTLNINFGYDSAREIRGKFVNTLWNTYSFFVNYARLVSFIPSEEPVSLGQRPLFDRWILSELMFTVKRVLHGFETFNARQATKAIEDFVEKLSNWYIRHCRRRFWKSDSNQDTKNAFNTLYHVLQTLIKLIAPVMPFMAEEMYQNLVRCPCSQKRRQDLHLPAGWQGRDHRKGRPEHRAFQSSWNQYGPGGRSVAPPGPESHKRTPTGGNDERLSAQFTASQKGAWFPDRGPHSIKIFL
ncbi:MAG: hypothetical protein CVV64_02990 [Candidatus Wallbacteria bacterium HGW-Wallbacteria-1]|uniref:Methionyl/Valyl/Leucyl/Isoleucyl-tRNA synthetase anticodon-binding domain-containing protein n=1 Tax=Candidatus Wallbacteria bacterium HGW-Wallbacteria-1 TaxID=2013854 RepID=A0A2N1PTH6_9BACT|nr:MAG: hypothetical protein CVV64_02990 [Candidatus Wallbacteria bacterium HGW-Wallbacteria-1]